MLNSAQTLVLNNSQSDNWVPKRESTIKILRQRIRDVSGQRERKEIGKVIRTIKFEAFRVQVAEMEVRIVNIRIDRTDTLLSVIKRKREIAGLLVFAVSNPFSLDNSFVG
jgi:hypothetical protein